MPEVACAVALAELERLDELTEMRMAAGRALDEVVADCDWLVPQKTPEDCVNSCWNYPVRILRDDIVWNELLQKFVELGGDGFYGAYQPIHLEPVFANLNKAVDKQPERWPHFTGRLPRYEKGLCPIWEAIQPRIAMLKTNYWDTDSIEQQADVLAKTIACFDA